MARGGVERTGPGAARRDFGTVDLLTTSLLEPVFTLKNDSRAPIVIERLAASCGCASAFLGNNQTAGPKTLAPGEETDVRVSVDVTGFQGPIRKSVRAYVSGSSTPAATLEITAQLKAPISFSPPVIQFGSVAAGSEQVQTLTATVDPRLARSGKLPPLVSSTPEVQVTPVPGQTQSPGDPTQPVVRTYTVRLPANARQGYVQGILRFAPPDREKQTAASFPALARASVYVTGQVTGSLTASPGMVVFFAAAPGKETRREVLLTASEASALNNVRVSCSRSWLSARLRPADKSATAAPSAPGSGLLLEVTLGAKAPVGGFHGEITVTTGAGERLVLPVYGSIARAASP